MSDENQPAVERSRISARSIAWAIVLLAAIIFVAQNTRKTKITFLVVELRTGVWLALVVAMVLGFFLGFVVRRRRGE